MKRFTSIILALVLFFALAVPTQADTKYLSGPFTFSRYAPVVRLRHKVYPAWTLQQQKSGSVSWCAKMYEERESQLFVILPTETTSYYSISAFDNPQLFLTYNKSNGKVSMSPATEKPDYDGGPYRPGPTQKFKFQWKTSVKTAGNRTVKNCYRLICQDGNKVVCFAGWAPFDIQQINA